MDTTFQPLAEKEIKQRYDLAKKQFASLGVDTEQALKTLAQTPVSLHCWQGDDVHGFEVHEESVAGGGIMSTGNYPGCATNGDMLRQDASVALALIPGARRFNIQNTARLPIDPAISRASDAGMIELFEGDWLDALSDTIEALPEAGK